MARRAWDLTEDPKERIDGFRAMLRWASLSGSQGAGLTFALPTFPAVPIDQKSTATLPLDRVQAILDAIPWERRGVYLAIAFESVRFSAASTATLDDFDPATGEIHWHCARKGKTLGSPVRGQKNRETVRRVPWAPRLLEWLAWRVRADER